MSTRTPGPWMVKANDNSGKWDVLFDGLWMCALESESRAAFIVEACNAHDALVEFREMYEPNLAAFVTKNEALVADNEDKQRALDAYAAHAERVARTSEQLSLDNARLREALTYCADHIEANREDRMGSAAAGCYASAKARAALAGKVQS